MWQEPILDRTREDIEQKRAKGFCNARDLNRLEENCAELAGLLGLTLSPRRSPWTKTDLPTAKELARVRENIRLLGAGWKSYHTTPPVPESPLNHWEKWNAAEQILLDIHNNYLDNRAALPHCGERWAGEGIGVL